MEWLIYLLKVSACLGLFYALYHFFLQKLTFFSVNRIYLLSTLIISFAIPALQLTVEKPGVSYSNQVKEDTTVYSSNLTDLQAPEAASPNPVPKAVEDADPINWKELLFTCYWLIAIIMLGVYAFQFLQLLKQTRHVSQKVGRLKVVFKSEGFTNCSFLNYVFVNQQELSEEEMTMILKHELVHVSRYHSIDKLLMSAFKALLWFNPLLYLYDKALEQVHEYEADKETSIVTGNTPYANVLLAMAVRKNNPSLAHSFVRNPLKGRIKMLFTSPSKNMKKLMYLAALPIGLALTWTFAVQVVYANYPVRAPKHTSAVRTQVSPVPEEKIPLNAAVPNKKIKIKNPLRTSPPDTLWMVDGVSPGKYSEVIIDGKSYDIDILKKISPRVISTFRGSPGRLEITTHNNRIEYATEIDRYNRIARNKALASGKIYVRYPQKSEDGSRYDWINIKVTGQNGGGGGLGLERGKKLLLIYEGKQYSERKFKALTADQLRNRSMSFRTFGSTKNEIGAKYGQEYSAMIEVFKPEILENRVFRDPRNVNDSNSKVSYNATDSVVVSKDGKHITLYGKVKLVKGQLNITAEKAKYEDAGQIVYAKNVSFTSDLYQEPVIKNFVKFDLKGGSYQVLSNIPDL